jgi:nucleoid-associated protein YgaU
MQKILLSSLFAAILLCSGCQTTYQNPSSVRSNEDRLLQMERQRRIDGRIETLEMEIARIGRELDLLRSQLEQRCAAIEQKSEEDKRELVARLTTQLEKLIKQSAPAPAPASSGNSYSGYGIEHSVQPGETLSTIAQAYGVTIKKLIEINQLKNPDRLQVGQKLFIPE